MFPVQLPRDAVACADVLTPPANDPVSPTPHDCPTILIADEDARMRRMFASCVRGFGYLVRPARDAAKAITLLDHEGIDALVADLSMPDKDTIALLTHVARHRPNLPVIVTCRAAIGYGCLALAGHRGARFTLAKPFLSDRVRAILRAALNPSLDTRRSA